MSDREKRADASAQCYYVDCGDGVTARARMGSQLTPEAVEAIRAVAKAAMAKEEARRAALTDEKRSAEDQRRARVKEWRQRVRGDHG